MIWQSKTTASFAESTTQETLERTQLPLWCARVRLSRTVDFRISRQLKTMKLQSL